MKVFTISQTKELDDYTIRHEPISSENLMQRASALFVHAFCEEISPEKKVWVFAGPGNNGGDARIIAQLIQNKKYKVELFFDIHEDFSFPAIHPEDVVIDGLFGSGINRPVTGIFTSLIDFLNHSGAKIYSIDIPSGLFGENNTGNPPDTIIKAYKTFTFQFPKLSFFFAENNIYTGQWKVLDIGLHPEIIQITETPYSYLQTEDIRSLLFERNKFSHKGNFGHALIIAGSLGKMGAAVLVARACLRAGAGLLTAYVPNCGMPIIQTALPEAMAASGAGFFFIADLPDLSSYQAIGVGPGIGKNPETLAVLYQLLKEKKIPLVLDADALNLISENEELKKLIPPKSILTPHPKEFDRLAGTSGNSYERLEKAMDLAAQLNVFIVLKGAYTAICTPDKRAFFNSTGNPGMATAGSGDVLTGIITGLLAQSYSSENAAKIGVFLHGMAGDLALENGSPESLIAGDIIDHLGKAFQLCCK